MSMAGKLRTQEAMRKILEYLIEHPEGADGTTLGDHVARNRRVIRGLTISDYDRAIQKVRRLGWVTPGAGETKRGERPTYTITQAGRDAYRGNE